ncbi:MAG: hypothetical protein CBD58_01485 [bacterium TMED198]|nr:MAG: hypothetical protein CBD58_01485 [bacterium TMED198]
MLSFLKLLGLLFSIFPRKLLVLTGEILGLFFFYFTPIRKKVAHKNLELIFPDYSTKKINHFIKQSYAHFFIVFLDFLQMHYLNKKSFEKIVKIDSSSLTMLNNINGCILMASHMGNWEMITPFFHFNQLPLSVVVQSQSSTSFNKFFHWARGFEGVELIPKKSPIETMKNSLIKNRFLALGSDQNAGKRGIEVKLFNQKINIPKGASLFHLQTKKPILYIQCLADKDYNYNIRILPLHEYSKQDKVENLMIINKINSIYSKLLESEIKKYPSQYFWFHRMFNKKIYNHDL